RADRASSRLPSSDREGSCRPRDRRRRVRSRLIRRREALSVSRNQSFSCDLLAACRIERFLRFQYRFGDSPISAAATEIAAHALADPLGVVARLALLDQSDGAHDLARGAEAALKAVMRDKGLLRWVEQVAVRHAFDRQDISAIVADREREAGIDPASVDDDRAGAALAAVAAFLCPRQIQPFAKKVEERNSWIVEFDGSLDTVDGQRG